MQHTFNLLASFFDLLGLRSRPGAAPPASPPPRTKITKSLSCANQCFQPSPPTIPTQCGLHFMTYVQCNIKMQIVQKNGNSQGSNLLISFIKLWEHADTKICNMLTKNLKKTGNQQNCGLEEKIRSKSNFFYLKIPAEVEQLLRKM